MERDLPIENGGMDAKVIAKIMRQRRATIRDLAERMNIAITRVRHVRTPGLDHPYFIRDWIQAIIGREIGPV